MTKYMIADVKSIVVNTEFKDDTFIKTLTVCSQAPGSSISINKIVLLSDDAESLELKRKESSDVCNIQ